VPAWNSASTAPSTWLRLLAVLDHQLGALRIAPGATAGASPGRTTDLVGVGLVEPDLMEWHAERWCNLGERKWPCRNPDRDERGRAILVEADIASSLPGGAVCSR
jgi:hypothetical protein